MYRNAKRLLALVLNGGRVPRWIQFSFTVCLGRTNELFNLAMKHPLDELARP